MRVLITGGAGFIGSNLADRLLARGDDVLVLDNYRTGLRGEPADAERLEVVEGSIADADVVDECFARFRPDSVVHAAASYKDPNDWQEDLLTNAVGTANLVRASQEAGVERLVYFQTALCYGLRPDETPITLAHPLRPWGSSYAISKTAGEHYITLSGLNAISLRLANVYGPRHLSGPLPAFYRRIVAGERAFVVDTRRDFVYLDDLLDVVLLALDGTGRPGVYHVSSGSDVSIADLFDAVRNALGRPDAPVELRPRGPDDAATLLLDPSVTEREFDWTAKTRLEDGVRATVDWYSEHGVEETYTHLKLRD
jgi:UDP-glucose 4-epimerase